MRSYVEKNLKLEHSSSTRSLLNWSCPGRDWIKLNSNGAVSHNGSHASIGGVFQDYNAEWLCGYMMLLGKDVVFKIEARAMVERLFIAWEKGFRRIEVECDNVLLVKLLLAGDDANSNLVELRHLHWKWEVRMSHIPMEYNGIADYMTKCVVISN
ncbi:hypothetical protein PVK06_048402 [Gossypium arboreum]|uniref:RNase H type-1 domain-containing protein n=1 Tax=Gossypium arboreum TaxID=29729 RepID=A0ABR0MFT3_GOSAR|nr:hypothetical protein PVK06_048402 [Gossypium arboreum]